MSQHLVLCHDLALESPIYGRIVRWGEGIVGGAPVKRGQLILEIQDIDPDRSQRLEAQVEASRQKLMFAKQKADTYAEQANELTFARQMVIAAGEELVEMSRRKVAAEKQALEAAKDFHNPRYMELLTPAHYEHHILRMPPAEWPDPVQRAFAKINYPIYLAMQGPSELGASGTLERWDRTADLERINVPTLV